MDDQLEQVFSFQDLTDATSPRKKFLKSVESMMDATIQLYWSIGSRYKIRDSPTDEW